MRTRVRAALHCFAAVGALAALASAASAQPAPPVSGRPPEPGVTFRAKKDYRLAKKRTADASADAGAQQRWRAALDARIGSAPDPVINIYSQWHREFLAIAVNDDLRRKVKKSLATEVVPAESSNRLLRCHFTQQPTEVDSRLIPIVIGAALHFGVERVNVVSGYRAPKYNLILQKKGREVARNSQHSLGQAIDFRLPGVNIQRLHKYVRGLRLGGVGFYTHSKFIHADVGSVRYWTGR